MYCNCCYFFSESQHKFIISFNKLFSIPLIWIPNGRWWYNRSAGDFFFCLIHTIYESDSVTLLVIHSHTIDRSCIVECTRNVLCGKDFQSFWWPHRGLKQKQKWYEMVSRQCLKCLMHRWKKKRRQQQQQPTPKQMNNVTKVMNAFQVKLRGRINHSHWFRFGLLISSFALLFGMQRRMQR